MPRNVVITVNIVKMVSTVVKIVAMIVAKIGVGLLCHLFDILECNFRNETLAELQL